jgi:chromosome segregation ATPase
MSVEERVLRLENAFATLQELAARSDARTGRLEDSFQKLMELAVSASERDDTQVSWINELGAAQTNADARIAALADAQIRTEEQVSSLTAQVGSLTARVDRLTELFERFIEGQQ